MARSGKHVALVIGNSVFIIAACLGFGLVLLTWTVDVTLAAEQEKAEESAQHSKVAVMVRVGHGRDKEQWFTPGAGKTESFQDCIDSACNIKGPEMVVVPKGSFKMGTAPKEIAALTKKYGDNFKYEGPQHEVEIAKPFAVGKFEVTWDDWDACVADGDCDNGPVKKASGDEGWGKGNRPVINVIWDDVQAYVKWLSEKTGKKYRLLSEAEWEYAARAETTTPFWWGSSISTDQANYDGIYPFGGGSKVEYRQKTVPVKSFKPNPWGLYQVHGNVWEWCEDRWHKNYIGAPDDGSAWAEGQSSSHVLRGGSWYYSPWGLRSAYRGGLQSDSRYNGIGFRVSRTLNP